MVLLTLLAASISELGAIGARSLEQVVAAYEGRIFTLQVSLHEPINATEAMQAPMLDRKGWHYHDTSRPAVLSAGTRVEVAAVFNYAERGLFLELARESEGFGKQPVDERPRMRVRIMLEADAADTSAQVAQAYSLIDKLLRPSIP